MSIVEPNVMQLLEHADTRYTLVVEAAKRGREILAGSHPMIESDETNPLRVAVEEIDRGLITYTKRSEAPEEQEERLEL